LVETSDAVLPRETAAKGSAMAGDATHGR